MNDLLSHLAFSALSCSAAVALILSMRKSMTRQFGAQVTYALWVLVPLASLATLLPAHSVVLVVKTIPAPTQMAATASSDLGVSGLSASQFDSGIDVAIWLCGLWIAGMAASLLLFLLEHHRFVRSLGRVEPLTTDLHRAQATQGCPALVGIWQPRIVLPADFEARYSASERELILAHERHHLARGDAAANALSTLLRSVFWFNPLVHFATPRFMADQELSCDAAVMAHFSNARRTYANAMLKAQVADFRGAWACPWSPRNLLKERIALLTYPSIGQSRRWLGGAVAVAMIVSGSVAAWASQPIETRTRYENLAPVDTPITDAIVRTHVAPSGAMRGHASPIPKASGAVGKASTNDIGTTSSKSIASASEHKGKVVAPLHDIALASVATRTPRKPTLPFVNIAPKRSTDTAEKVPVEQVSAVEAKAGDDRSPREIASYRRHHEPKYPPAAVRAHVQGNVLLDVGVDENGNPTDARVASLAPSTATELASASLVAVTQWLFEPAQRNGRVVAGRLAVPFVFALSGDSTYAAPEERRQANYRTVGAGDYPQGSAGIEGVVYVRVRIEDDGTVSSSEVDHVDPPSANNLGALALSALRAWTFNPASDRGKAIASTPVVPIIFGADAQSSPAIARTRNSLDPIRLTPKRS